MKAMIWLPLCFLGAAVGCEGPAELTTECSEFVVSTTSATLEVGDSAEVSASRDSRCRRAIPPGFVWQSSDSAVISVSPTSDSTAFVHALGSGEAVITWLVPGSPSAPSVAVRSELSRETNASFQTSSLAYTLVDIGFGWQMRIPVAYTNRTSQPVYIVNCSGATFVALEKRTQYGWQYEWSAFIPLCLSPPIIVPAGVTYNMTVDVFGGYPQGNTYPKFANGKLKGVFRLVWSDFLTSFDDRARPFGDKLPIELRRSNQFEIR